MFKKRITRPSVARHNDQLPFLAQKRFSALPRFRAIYKEESGLSLFIAVSYVIDLFGVFPLVTLPGLLIPLGLFAIPLVLVIVGLQIYTSNLLGKCWIMAEMLDSTIAQKSRYPYAAISDLAYGKHVSLMVTILLDLSIFATGIPNLVVAAQNLQLIGVRITDGHFNFSFCFWLIILGVLVCPLMWLESPKNMRGLVLFSVCVVASVVVLLWYCLIKAEGGRKPFQGMTFDVPSFAMLFNGFNVLAFQFDIHSMILTIQMDMKDKTQIKWASLIGILCSCGLGVIGAVIGAYKFGSMVLPNILEMIPRSVPLYIAIILISLQLCLTCVVGSSALFLHVENFFRVPETFSAKRILIRSTLIGLEVLVGEFVPKFDVIVGIIGGTIIAPLMFIMPPLLYRKIQEMEKTRHRFITQAAYGSLPLDLNYECIDIRSSNERNTLWTSICNAYRQICKYSPCEMSFPSAVVAFGVLAFGCSTFLNFLRISELFQNNSPCFGNITKTLSNL
ncbi:proton-coupled amino acid transporter 2 [Episyrphus balteatus]|uniref:proton-coupled amino acid transporter 2 n=1 Tax=Episyrphus balteatus TaxID=286459 RepID=UPI002486CB24|nr:proton-coupled amino acid transporter 2 [Episyrphus balteatus]